MNNLPKMGSMKSGLLLKDLVLRASLPRRTARYVLDKAKRLAVRRADGQGAHRRFDANEAVRLAICTGLATLGVPLDKAERVTAWCERQWLKRATKQERDGGHPFAAHIANPWRLSLINGRYVRVERETALDPEHDSDTEGDKYYDIEADRKIHWADIPAHLPIVSWNLTALTFALSKE